VNYRQYRPQDFAALYALEERCFEPTFRFSRAYMREIVNGANRATWIAEDDERMTGFAIVEWTEEARSLAAYIQTIEVAPEQRGRGVGGELLRRMKGSARAAGAETIWLHVDAGNAGAIRLYEAQGFRSVGREENYYPRGRTAIIYSKRLSSGEVG
jgi:ribosomal protein S18 acetylase RimI-like enzyme